jgi:hypothetical protein
MGERYFSTGSTIYVFVANKAAELIATLKEMDLLVPENDPDGARIERLTAKVKNLLKRTPHLATTKVGPKGVFKTAVRTSAKELLIVSFYVNEEGDEVESTIVKADQASLSSSVMNHTPEYPYPGPCPPAPRRVR